MENGTGAGNLEHGTGEGKMEYGTVEGNMEHGTGAGNMEHATGETTDREHRIGAIKVRKQKRCTKSREN
jgi:hypothetical protein